MSDPATDIKRFSVKKTVGVVGALCLYGIGLYAVWKDPSQAASILWPLGGFTAALFGIKTFGGAMSQRNNGGAR